MSIVIHVLAGMVAAPPPIVASAPAACIPATVMRGATVVALGMYGGRGARAPFRFGGTSQSVRAVAVTGRGTGKIVLFVSAHEPTVWDLSAVKGRIKAVYAQGYYPQAVAGVGNDVPVRFNSTLGLETTTSADCRWPWFKPSYEGTFEIERMADAAKRLIGSHPRRFYGGYHPNSFDIDGGTGVFPQIPRPANVRAEVPLSLDGAVGGPSLDNELAPRAAERDFLPAKRIVEWDENGTIIRDEGGGTIAPRSPASRAVVGDQRQSSRAVGSSPFGRLLAAAKFLLLVWVVTLGALLVWLWRRHGQRNSRERYDPSWSEPPAEAIQLSNAEIAKAETSFPHSDIAQLASLSALTASEPLVIGLHRYGRALQAIARATFDDDLAEEAKAIVKRHFSHAVARYRQARPSLDGDEAAHADETLRRALERLKVRLEELIDEQHRRDMAGIDAAGRFIESRHPSD